ncbi:MAG: heavy metal translocating P-type ATPase [Anaerolineae bacterium]
MSANKTYHIGNLDCANCARELETGIGKLDGVDSATVNFSNLTLTVSGDVPFNELQKRTKQFGHTLAHQHEQASAGAPHAPQRKGVLGFGAYLLTRNDTRIGLIGLGLVIIGVLMNGLLPASTSLSTAVYTLALTIAVYPIVIKGLNALRINHRFTIDLLMAIAGIGALIIGEYIEAATVVFLYSIGEALEGYITSHARDSIGSLLALQPKTAIRVQERGEETIDVNHLHIGDQILVKPGERIPMDGVVTAGHSAVNQAALTGESLPISKTEGTEVFAGSINGNGALTVRVTASAQDNTLSRIVQMVSEAQGRQAPSQRMIDQFAQYYTPAVVIFALLIAVVPPLFFGQAFIAPEASDGWLYRALTILVIACPCALVISTPVTVISAISRAAKQGVLIKGGAYLEALSTVDVIAFDKTGTLTEGQPVVMETRSIDCETGDTCALCDDVLALAAAIESRSTHPLAQAVVNEAQARDILHRYSPAHDVENLSGQGIRGMIDQQQVVVGSHALFDQEFAHSEQLCRMVQDAEGRGHSTMLLHDGERVRGYIAVADKVRASSPAVVSDLNRFGLQTVMLTGDNATVAEAVGEKVRVSDVRASLMPDDKVSAVEALMDESHQVAMIGDGVNDTPALATATVGVAMGGAGTAQAMETADVVLMGDDLQQLPFAIKLSRHARTLIIQNIVLAIGMKLIFLLLATGGEVTMWMAIFADVGMSLIVTLNGMRALRFQYRGHHPTSEPAFALQG